MENRRRNPFYNNPYLWMNVGCSFAGAVVLMFLWTLVENWFIGICHFGDRLYHWRAVYVCFFTFALFYWIGLIIFNHGIRQSTRMQKWVIYGAAVFYFIIISGVASTVKDEVDTYAYIEQLQDLKDNEILSFTATYQDRELQKRTIQIDESTRTTKLRDALLQAEAYRPNHDQWLLEGTLKIQFKGNFYLVFDWYVPLREPEVLILEPNSDLYIVVDNNWLEENNDL